MRHFLSRVSLALGLIYVIPLTAYVLLRDVPSAAPWWLALADTFALYLFIPTVPILLFGLLSFSRLTLLLCLLPIVLFLSMYGQLFLPKNLNSTDNGVSFTVMTHNIDAWNPNPRKVTQAIVEADPDIVALQELEADTAELLAADLSNKYRYQALLTEDGFSGVGILSRFPIETEESFTVGHLAQHLVLDINGQKVHLFNFHPQPPQVQWKARGSFPPFVIRSFSTERQSKQWATLMEKVDEADGPIIAIGDFNTTDQTRHYKQFTQKLTDVYREVGWGFGHTFPANDRFLWLPLPIIRIDYIFHSSEIVGLDARVGNNTGSDHLPLIATLTLKNPKNSDPILPSPSNP